MPYAVTHVIVSIALVNLFRKHVLKKKDFLLSLVLFAGLAGLLPDFDVIVYWILRFFQGISSSVHLPFTHSFFIPIISLLIALLLWRWKNTAHIFLIMAAGWTIHITLDVLFLGKAIFYPISSVKYGFFLIPEPLISNVFMSIDAVVLVIWLFYEWKFKKIRDYS